MEQKTKLCKHCKKEIDLEASRCPHCHGKIYIWTKWKKILIGFIIFTVFILVITGSSGNKNSSTENISEIQTTGSEQSISKEQAQKELDKFMPMAQKAGLVTSYDFSKLDDKVYRWDIYVGKTWYIQTVQQKKDFIAYIGIHKKAITGFSHFELRDGYTNEKVGEITAFSSSIEVYK